MAVGEILKFVAENPRIPFYQFNFLYHEKWNSVGFFGFLKNFFKKGVFCGRSLCKFCHKSFNFILSCTKLGLSSLFRTNNYRLQGFLFWRMLISPPSFEYFAIWELLFDIMFQNREGNSSSPN